MGTRRLPVDRWAPGRGLVLMVLLAVIMAGLTPSGSAASSPPTAPLQARFISYRGDAPAAAAWIDIARDGSALVAPVDSDTPRQIELSRNAMARLRQLIAQAMPSIDRHGITRSLDHRNHEVALATHSGTKRSAAYSSFWINSILGREAKVPKTPIKEWRLVRFLKNLARRELAGACH